MFSKRCLEVLALSMALSISMASSLSSPATLPTPTSGPEKSAKPLDYMAALRKAESAITAAGEDEAKKRSAWQAVAVEQSFVGDTERAIESFHQSGLRPSLKSPADRVTDPAVRDALDAIVDAVRDRQVVMINEAHHVPRDRAFATLVALELRKLGFRYLAMETLNERRTDALAVRGYPLDWDGYYSRDPVFGDFIRRALAVGFIPVAYEHSNFEESDPQKRLERRERGQAANLVDRILQGTPGRASSSTWGMGTCARLLTKPTRCRR